MQLQTTQSKHSYRSSDNSDHFDNFEPTIKNYSPDTLNSIHEDSIIKYLLDNEDILYQDDESITTSETSSFSRMYQEKETCLKNFNDSSFLPSIPQKVSPSVTSKSSDEQCTLAQANKIPKDQNSNSLKGLVLTP